METMGVRQLEEVGPQLRPCILGKGESACGGTREGRVEGREEGKERGSAAVFQASFFLQCCIVCLPMMNRSMKICNGPIDILPYSGSNSNGKPMKTRKHG